MPEGDTIHQIAGLLRSRLEGVRLEGGTLAQDAQLSLAGRRVEGVESLGKHLLLHLDRNELLRVHLGMHGSWRRYAKGAEPKAPEPRRSVVLELAGETLVCLDAKEVERLRAGGLHERDLRRRLGPDLMGAEPDFDAVLERVRGQADTTPLCQVLLDQGIACGIGNVYKCETLFLERLHPLTKVGALDDARLLALYRRAHLLLRSNEAGGPRRTRGSRGIRGDGGGELWVYRRGGRPCARCRTPIARERLGRPPRSTYWCPACQERAGRQEGAESGLGSTKTEPSSSRTE